MQGLLGVEISEGFFIQRHSIHFGEDKKKRAGRLLALL
jgi:hypothetical protein